MLIVSYCTVLGLRPKFLLWT